VPVSDCDDHPSSPEYPISISSPDTPLNLRELGAPSGPGRRGTAVRASPEGKATCVPWPKEPLAGPSFLCSSVTVTEARGTGGLGLVEWPPRRGLHWPRPSGYEAIPTGPARHWTRHPVRSTVPGSLSMSFRGTWAVLAGPGLRDLAKAIPKSSLRVPVTYCSLVWS
jgi:hypothetical protein